MAKKNNTPANYSVTISEVSKELTAKQRVMLKDTGDAIRLDEATRNDESVIVDVDYYAVLNVHNEKADDPDYLNFIIVDKNGQKYVTGSNTLINTFISIAEEMKDLPEDESFTVKIYARPSKNYNGKSFITCSLV